ncbi:MAG: D-amino-acid oxidase [Sphingomonas sp. SCN 67-18]|uniref:NAD(P)/FAD-dependent oxidoreductase n=1 Tax=uncultured Sphingomonas sp. TaxID=158754 RepID=UPI00086E8396|nr:FAD-binding oxidoreductase [Sphingomonas sp. SCN 67-18]ODU22876.1 MAG: D-amino-acid oxidase [Sphingomonas sp. SCN 67-18]
MPSPMLDTVANAPALPDQVDAVIIGGGIVGATTALELAERGLKVALCEKGQIGCEQSGRNMGWVRLSHRDPREMPLMIESVRLWEELNARTGGETGYRQCGITYACASEASLKDMVHWLGEQHAYGVPAREISTAEALAPYPGLAIDLVGAVLNPRDGRAEPQKATAAIARAAQRLGVTIHQQCAVRVVERSAGRISGVVTEKGRIGCSMVLVAGGAWSRNFLHNMGIRFPQLRMKSSSLRTAALPGGPDVTFKCSDFTFTKRLDGGYTVSGGAATKHDITPDSLRLMRPFIATVLREWKSIHLGLGATFFRELFQKRRWGADDITPFERTRILDPEPDADLVDPLLERIRKVYPFFRDVEIAQHWAGQMDVMPDAIPVISAVDAHPGLFVSSGYSGHGFGLGPGAGRLTADIMTGSAPVVDPHEFRLARFTDGSAITAMSGVTRR